MTEANANAAKDWTEILRDPDLSKNLGKLLQTYRQAPPEQRDEVLLEAMKAIKKSAMTPARPAGGGVEASVEYSSGASSEESSRANSEKSCDNDYEASSGEEFEPAAPTAASSVPPFEPDIFSPGWGQDRRRNFRMKCFVAVELRVNDAESPIWGNLSNTAMGGCLVETAAQISGGSKVEIGLWVASGKIWVKGLALNGVVSRSAAAGVRIKFAGMDPAGKENLRQFLKYIQDTTKVSKSESHYLQMLK